MALPFLPEEEIEPMFQRLQRHASEPLQQFTEYVNDTWINGTWGPSDWTAFKKAIRSNNDVEDKTEDFDGKCSNEVSYTGLSVAYKIYACSTSLYLVPSNLVFIFVDSEPNSGNKSRITLSVLCKIEPVDSVCATKGC